MADTATLLELTAQLRGQLSRLQSLQPGQVDTETRESLQALRSDITQLLGPDHVATDEARSVANSLREALVDFEAEHPQLTSLLGRLGDALANLGI